MSLEMLYSESSSAKGCDRLLLHDARLVIVQGTHVGDRADYAAIQVPEGETLDSYIQRRSRRPLDRAAGIARYRFLNRLPGWP